MCEIMLELMADLVSARWAFELVLDFGFLRASIIAWEWGAKIFLSDILSDLGSFCSWLCVV